MARAVHVIGTCMANEREPDLGLVASYRRIWRDYLATEWRLLLVTLVLMAIVAGTSALYAKFVQVLFAAFDLEDWAFLGWAPAMVIGLTVLRGVAQFLQVVTANLVMSRVEADMQARLYARLLVADLAHLQIEKPAALATRFSADIGAIRAAVDALIAGLSNILIVVATLAMMLSINWSMTLITLAVFGLAIWPIGRIGLRVNKIARALQQQVAQMTGDVNEGLASIRLVRTYGLEARMQRQADETFEALRKAKVRVQLWQARSEPLLEVVGGVSFAVLLWMVVWQLSQGSGSLADFMALLTGLGVAMTPSRRIGGMYAVAQRGLASVHRVTSLMDMDDRIVDRPGNVALKQVAGRLQFDGVGFAYPDGTRALTQLNLTIEAAEKVAFVGRSGAGKSTVFNILPRLFDPTEGRILLDGTPITDIPLATLRSNIAVVSQDSLLLSGTVADNIAFGRDGASREDVIAAAKAAEADGFIQQLEAGYDTVVEPSAASYSGGERQRISIARAILRDAPILLLDEPTSALDAKSESAIRAALARLSKGRTTLVIAHRLSTILDADQIVVMEAGQIVEMGSHAQLLAANGAYAELYRLQYEGAPAV